MVASCWPVSGKQGWKPIPSMAEVVAKYSDGRGESKLGEGTYGEAFRVRMHDLVRLQGQLVLHSCCTLQSCTLHLAVVRLKHGLSISMCHA